MCYKIKKNIIIKKNKKSEINNIAYFRVIFMLFISDEIRWYVKIYI